MLTDAKDSSFSRSRSSSMTSIDKESREIISSLHFCDSLSKKSDVAASPSLWVGTSVGTMLGICFSLPSSPEQRLQQTVGVSLCGKRTQKLSKLFIKGLSHAKGLTV